MSERILYEFDGFRLDPLARSLFHNGEPVSLRPIAFELLLALVEHRGQTLTKSEIVKRVWGSYDDVDADNKFHVTLRAVRQALEGSDLEDAAKGARLIVKDANGYRIAATVREVPIDDQLQSNVSEPTSSEESLIVKTPAGLAAGHESEIVQLSPAPGNHLAHILTSCAIYGVLYGSAIVLEVAYEFDRFGSSALKISPLVFGWVLMTSAAGLKADQKLTLQNRRGGLVTSIVIFIGSAFVVLLGIPFLPSSPVTLAQFQTYAAQAAYLKDVVYFLILAFLFLILPFHSVLKVEGKMERGQYDDVVEICTAALTSPSKQAIYPGFWMLTFLLLIIALTAVVMVAHLLDNLKPGPYINLFTLLIYLRGILYFGLGIECLIWYYSALSDLKRECIVRIGDF